MTRRKTEIVIRSVRYPRFGHSRCDQCGRMRLLFYVTPKVPGRAVCAQCIEAVIDVCLSIGSRNRHF